MWCRGTNLFSPFLLRRISAFSTTYSFQYENFCKMEKANWKLIRSFLGLSKEPLTHNIAFDCLSRRINGLRPQRNIAGVQVITVYADQMDGHHSALSSSVPRSWSCYSAPCAASWSGRNGSANEGPMIHLWGRNSHAKVPTNSITSSNLHRKYSTLFNMFSGIKLLTATSFHSVFPSFHSTALQKLQCGN